MKYTIIKKKNKLCEMYTKTNLKSGMEPENCMITEL